MQFRSNIVFFCLYTSKGNMLLQYDCLSSDVTNAMWVDENNVYKDSY